VRGNSVVRHSVMNRAQFFILSVTKGVAILFSFEALFVLFLLAGRFKADPRFAWVPIDLTLLFLALSLLSAVTLLILGKVRVTRATFWGVLLYLTFSAWIGFTLIWAPASAYAIDKVLRILTLVFWAYAAPALIIASEPERVLRFYFLLVLASVWLAIESWVTYLAAGSTEPQLENILGGNYLGVSRVLGIAVDILIVGFLLERRFLRRMGFVGLIVWFLLTLLVIGGRGPFLAAAASVLAAFVLFGEKSFSNWFKSMFGLVFVLFTLGALSPMISSFLPLTTLHRLETLLEEPGGGTSAQGRLERIGGALRQISEAPVFGQGVGSFYWYYGDPTLTRDYPHNIILELWSETGLVGLFLFFLLMFHAVRKIKWAKLSQHPMHFVAILILVNAFLNALVSGDVPDNRLLFVALGLITGLPTLSLASKGERK